MKLLCLVGLPLYKTKLWERKSWLHLFLVVQVLYFSCHCSNDQVIEMWLSYKSTKKRKNKSVNFVPISPRNQYEYNQGKKIIISKKKFFQKNKNPHVVNEEKGHGWRL